MKTYWDTSAAINAAVSESVSARLDHGEHVTRLYLFEEFFTTMTGRGVSGIDPQGQPVRVVFSPKDCATWLKGFSKQVSVIELRLEDMLHALDKAEPLGVQGAKVYDYAHATAAIKSGADELATRNTRHFDGLTGKTKVVWP